MLVDLAGYFTLGLALYLTLWIVVILILPVIWIQNRTVRIVSQSERDLTLLEGVWIPINRLRPLVFGRAVEVVALDDPSLGADENHIFFVLRCLLGLHFQISILRKSAKASLDF